MNWQIVCQWLMVVNVVVSFFLCVRMDFHGRKAKEPGGFSGFIGTIVSVGIMAAVYYQSGAFDLIILWGK